MTLATVGMALPRSTSGRSLREPGICFRSSSALTTVARAAWVEEAGLGAQQSTATCGGRAVHAGDVNVDVLTLTLTTITSHEGAADAGAVDDGSKRTGGGGGR